jgi:hypothetical protein
MEPGNGEINKPPQIEASEVDKDNLNSRIADGIKRHLFGETAITHRIGTERLEWNCFLTTPDGDKSLVISYLSLNKPRPDRSIDVRVVDRASSPPSGYVLAMSDPASGSWIDFLPHLYDLDRDDAENIFEVAYGTTYEDYDYDEDGNIQKGKPTSDEDRKKSKDKNNLRIGLLLIDELLSTAGADAEATRIAQEWLEDTQDEARIRDLNELNALLPTIATDVNTALSYLPHVVNDAFSSDANSHEVSD